MKKSFVLLLLCYLAVSFTFAQTEEEVKEEFKKSMEQLKEDMEQLREDLQESLGELKIDLSGLDALKEIDWANNAEYQEGMAYLKSDEFKKEMASVQVEVEKAMEEVREEMAKIEEFNFTEINKVVEEAMKEVEEELSKVRKKKE